MDDASGSEDASGFNCNDCMADLNKGMGSNASNKD
jgi:hypothetical protein